MKTLSVLIQALLSFSGIGIWIASLFSALREKKGPYMAFFLLYAALFTHILTASSLITAYQLEGITALLARNGAAASVFIAIALFAKTTSRFLALLAVAWILKRYRSRIFGFIGLMAALVWIIILSAQEGFGIFPPWTDLGMKVFFDSILLMDGLFLIFTRGSANEEPKALRPISMWALFGYLPLHIALMSVDFLMPHGLSPLLFIYADLVFFLALNLYLYWRLSHAVHRPRLSRDEGMSIESLSEEFTLSPRESEIAALLLNGLAYKVMAQTLCISPDTVKSHAKSVYRKTGCRNRQELLRLVGNHPYFTPEVHRITPKGDTGAGSAGGTLG
jgi:DNA-binding CsgD family transcriptional regulator